MFKFSCGSIFSFLLGIYLVTGIASLNGNSVCYFLGNCQTAFWRDCEGSKFLHPCKHLLVSGTFLTPRFSLLLGYSWHTILHEFPVYGLVIWQVSTCCCVHQSIDSYHLSHYIVIAVSLTYIPYAVPFILVTYSFHSWKPLSPAPLHPFCLTVPPSSLATSSLILAIPLAMKWCFTIVLIYISSMTHNVDYLLHVQIYIFFKLMVCTIKKKKLWDHQYTVLWQFQGSYPMKTPKNILKQRQ